MQNLLARSGYKIKWIQRQRSPSGKGWHIRVKLDRPTSCWMEMVALQAILGSDRYREACNVQRVRTIEHMSPDMRAFWEPRWNVLYERR